MAILEVAVAMLHLTGFGLLALLVIGIPIAIGYSIGGGLELLTELLQTYQVLPQPPCSYTPPVPFP